MKQYILILWLGLLPCMGWSQGYYKFTPDIRKAYDLAIELRASESRALLSDIKKQTPDNLLIDLVEDYNDFFELFITEDSKRFKELAKNKKARFKRLESGDKNSPYHLFTKAEIHLHWAAARLKFEENFTAAREIFSAYHLLEENVEKFPDFKANKKSLSIIYALAESVPSWVRSVTGITGSIALGTDESRRLVEYAKTHEDFPFKEECYAIYAYILVYQNNQKEKAYQILKNTRVDINRSPLLTFLMANVAQKNGYNDEAISLLENRTKHAESLPFYYLDFMLGKYKMYRLDRDANTHILQFVTKFSGKHFVKEAYQKLAWYELVIAEDPESYQSYIGKTARYGAKLTDEDKQALYEHKENSVPDPILMKARMLFDGGYYKEALDFLSLHTSTFSRESDAYEEYNYRIGRIHHRLRNYDQALLYYGLVCDMDREDLFHCSSALNSGLIYEDRSEYKNAFAFYKKCLDIHPERYRQSMHQKAKTGIKRISEKEGS